MLKIKSGFSVQANFLNYPKSQIKIKLMLTMHTQIPGALQITSVRCLRKLLIIIQRELYHKLWSKYNIPQIIKNYNLSQIISQI